MGFIFFIVKYCVPKISEVLLIIPPFREELKGTMPSPIELLTPTIFRMELFQVTFFLTRTASGNFL